VKAADGPLTDAPPPYDAVVFDCDSTLCALEGIEELAGDHPEVARLTRAAMEGRAPLEQVYGRRLELVRPTRADVERIGVRYRETLLPNAARLCAALVALGKRVAIVSGGLLPAVRSLALALGLPPSSAHAVDVFFDAQGRYAGFDAGSPLARAGGKRVLLARLRSPGERLALVGDGATDLEAAPEADRFVAFAGVERRAGVLAAARVACLDPDFRALVPLLLAEPERRRLAEIPAHAPLVRLAPGPSPPTA
jgi:phosphoserine phosphatase